MEVSIEKRFEVIRDAYAQGLGMFPTTVFIDLKWGIKEPGVKEKGMSIGIPLRMEDNIERLNCLKKLGFASATMFKLGLTSEPDQVLIASEAYASVMTDEDIKKSVKSKKGVPRPSEDPGRLEVAIVHARNKDNQSLGAVREIVSIWNDTKEAVSMTKDLAITDRMKKNKLGKMLPMESPLLDEFWVGYEYGLVELEKEKKLGGVSYMSFIDVVKENPALIMNEILDTALNQELK